MLLSPVTILIALTVAASAYAWSNPNVLVQGVLDPYEMNENGGQWYRFLTSGFLHADWGHLLFNMFTLYSFGGVVLSYFSRLFGNSNGLLLFLLLYLGGIVLSDLPTYFRHRHDPDYRSLGASGGVSSVLFAGVLFQPTSGIIMLPIPFPIPGFIWAVLYLFYSYYMGRRRGDNINHDAHFYGALYGVVLTAALVPGILPYFLHQVMSFRL